MKLTFNVTKETKKAFVNVLAEITGNKPVYQFTPTYAYAIGDLTVNRDATLTTPDDRDLSSLLTALNAMGYKLIESDNAEMTTGQEPEAETVGEPAEPETDESGITEYTISLPLTSANVGTLTNMINAKESLIKKALGITDTRINVTEEKIEFPWFERELSPKEVHAYTTFLSLLCKLSKELKHASSRPVETDNEKYAFRCFLLRLGFIGADYKEDRKVLLQNLTGSAAFRNGAPVKEVQA